MRATPTLQETFRTLQGRIVFAGGDNVPVAGQYVNKDRKVLRVLFCSSLVDPTITGIVLPNRDPDRSTSLLPASVARVSLAAGLLGRTIVNVEKGRGFNRVDSPEPSDPSEQYESVMRNAQLHKSTGDRALDTFNWLAERVIGATLPGDLELNF